ncbi:LPS-assembly lipoprotein LptE [Pseudomonas sp.]|uniref:LPS-assembly lipoprotein LptE n=1 Tax=Pseudomonas sp. TaxID=306 RepID=UPI00272BF921|nr:LPS assembly lipoprotein LptE [Pseudomonas sp.]
MHLNPCRPLGYLMIAALLLLAGCGFQLRGTGVDSVSLRELAIAAPDPNSPTYLQLREALEEDNVRLTDAAEFTLQLIGESHDRVALSYTGRASAAEVEIRHNLSFQITDTRGQPLVGPESLSVRRVYINDRDNIVGTAEEEELLRREMRRDMVRQLLFRLSSLSERELAARSQALQQQAP